MRTEIFRLYHKIANNKTVNLRREFVVELMDAIICFADVITLNDIDYWNSFFPSIINRIFYAAFLAIKSSDYSCRMIYHPFVANLKTTIIII